VDLDAFAGNTHDGDDYAGHPQKKKNHLLVLLASLFVVSIGFGITLPVLPFYGERIAMGARASHQMMVVNVGLLTGVFSLMQLLLAPLSGWLSDRIGRRPLLLQLQSLPPCGVPAGRV
jgi:MFS family permease